ncbi:MAG: carbon-nitrogen hydrolase [Chloroflexi bacterium]|nr:carbon-nitrogen hydrolase [Chloroflexota bacterium]
MNNLTLGLAQIHPKFGDVKANVRRHLEIIDEAADNGVQLLIFPELSLTGYVLQDLVYEVALTADSDDLQPIREASLKHGMDVMFGFVDVDQRGRYFIAAAYVSGGKILHVHHKIYLPTYGLFDEGRFFAPGETIRAFDTSFGRVGMLICEDFWHASPNYVLWMDGADLLLLHSASPGRGVTESETLGTARWVELVNQSYGSMFTNYVVHCNRVGYEGGLVFWGGSTIVDPDGEFALKAPYFEEELLVHTIDLNQLRRTRSRLPLLRDERLDLTVRELGRISQK